MEYSSLNWNDVWKREIDLWKGSSGKSCKDYWADKESAAVYAREHDRYHQKRVEKTLEGLDLKPEYRVLDIGAGPGNLAIPMAGRVYSVTTVEPSSGMGEVMKSEMRRQKVLNIVSIEKTWEELDPERDLDLPYDLVIASMSLGMRDIQAAVEKMNKVCSGVVALFWHAGIPGWEDMPKALWPQIYGKTYHGGPKSDVLFQVLYQMGIYPQIQVFSNHFQEVFPSLDAAMDYYCRRFEQIQPEHRPFFESYLQNNCRKTREGVVHGFEHVTMKFSWDIKGGFNEKAA